MRYYCSDGKRKAKFGDETCKSAAFREEKANFLLTNPSISSTRLQHISPVSNTKPTTGNSTSPSKDSSSLYLHHSELPPVSSASFPPVSDDVLLMVFSYLQLMDLITIERGDVYSFRMDV